MMTERLSGFFDQIALCDNVNQITYGQLLTFTKQLHYKIQRVNNSQNTIVAIDMSRSVENVIAMMTCFLHDLPFILINAQWSKNKKNELLLKTGANIKISHTRSWS